MKYKKVVQPSSLHDGAHCPLCGRGMSLSLLFGSHRLAHFHGQFGLSRAKMQFEVTAVIDTTPEAPPHPLAGRDFPPDQGEGE